MFNSSNDIVERAVSFRDERLSKIKSRLGPVPFEDNGRLIIHVLPFVVFQYADPIDIDVAFEYSQYFQPMTSSESSTNATPNFYGLLVMRRGTKCFGYTQVFRDGSIEATKAGLLDRYNGEPIVRENRVREPLSKFPLRYIEGLKIIRPGSPAILFVSLTGVAGSKLAVPDGEDELDEILPFPPEEPLCFPPVIVDNFGNRSHVTEQIKELNNMLWYAAGRDGCPL